MNSIFDKEYLRYDEWYKKNKFAYLSELAAVSKFIPRVGEGLEIGVGTGRFAAVLGIRNGIDPSRNMLKIAQKRGVNVKAGSGESIPFPDESFDYAAIIISICFVKDPCKVLKETARVLKKNGIVIIGIVDKDSFLGKFYRKKRSAFYKKAEFLSVKEVKEILKKNGFGRSFCYQTLSVLPADMKSAEKPVKGHGKRGFVVISAKKSGK